MRVFQVEMTLHSERSGTFLVEAEDEGAAADAAAALADETYSRAGAVYAFENEDDYDISVTHVQATGEQP